MPDNMINKLLLFYFANTNMFIMIAKNYFRLMYGWKAINFIIIGGLFC